MHNFTPRKVKFVISLFELIWPQKGFEDCDGCVKQESAPQNNLAKPQMATKNQGSIAAERTLRSDNTLQEVNSVICCLKTS